MRARQQAARTRMNGTPRSNIGKYQSPNPVVQALLRRYFGALDALLVPAAPTRVLDVGAGEGLTAEHLRTLPVTFDYLGLELDPNAVADARTRNPGWSFEVGDIYHLAEQRRDVVLCLEVLEHLDDPARAVDSLHGATERLLIASVPWEPWFRLGNLVRGKYLDRLGNHPEHVQQFSPRTFRALLERRFRDVTVHTSFPWVFACGVPR